MGLLRHLNRPAAGLALPRRTVRLRFTALYGVVFLLSGAVLLAIAGIVAAGATRVTKAAPVQPPGDQTSPSAQAHIDQLQHQLSQAQSAQSSELLLGSAVALAVMVVMSVALGWFVAGRVLRPLRMVTAATQRISADNLHERLAVQGPGDEVKDLADTIDELLERLEGAFAAQRRFVANASHELRTPLATMRASLDVAVAKPEPAPPQTIALADRLRAELDQVDRLLEGFLVLARTQHGELPGHATLSLGPIVSEALAERGDDITAKGLTVHETIHRDVWVQGSRTLLRRMVDNVIDNAVGHNDDGGWIHIVTEADGEAAQVVVKTGGRILDQRQVEQLAQPFRRLAAERTGSGAGLGLSIVASIANAHRGTLDLHARPDGGLRVGISLPLVGRPSDTEQEGVSV
jgi:signal transduction histidine kinase